MTGRWPDYSAAFICCPSFGRSMAPMRASIRSITPGSIHGLGSWDEVRALAERTDVMADLIVNHISSQSPQFADFRKRGDASSYAFMFLTYGRVFPDGASEDGTAARSIARGQAFLSRKCVWTMELSDSCGLPSPLSKLISTFVPPQGKRYVDQILNQFQHGRHSFHPARCRRLRHQEARHELLHDSRDL